MILKSEYCPDEIYIGILMPEYCPIHQWRVS
jgi:hypothetical protein